MQSNRDDKEKNEYSSWRERWRDSGAKKVKGPEIQDHAGREYHSGKAS